MTYPEWYERISKPFRSAEAMCALDVVDRGLVFALAAAYIAALAWLGFRSDVRFWKALVVPGATFGVVTALRTAVDRPRPYVRYGINPLIAKERRGKSFPSRHVSSAVAIACALLWLDPIWGAAAFAACTVVSCTRIVGGVHFPSDVGAAIAIAAACAVVGFLIIP